MIPASRHTKWLRHLYILFIATIVVFLLGDIARKIGLHTYSDFIRYTAISKGLVIIMYLVVLMYYIKLYKKDKLAKQLGLFIVLLSSAFLIGQAFISDSEPYDSRLSKQLVYVSRFLFLPVTFLIFYPLLKEKKHLSKLFRFFEVIFFLNCLIIIFAAIVDVPVFRTYFRFNRYGYMGLYNSNNQASFYFMFMISYYYYETFFRKKLPYKLIFVVLCSLLIGTKKLYFFFPLLLLFDFLYFKRFLKKWFWACIALVTISIVVFYQRISEFITLKFEILVDVYHRLGFVASITSGRSIHLTNTINDIILPKWTWINYIFGGSQFYISRPEMEVIDVYIFFGIIGVAGYIWLFKKLIHFFEATLYLKSILFIFIFVGLFAGGFIVSANQPIIFLLVFSCIAIMEKEKLISHNT
jgi:hypothetical protein